MARFYDSARESNLRWVEDLLTRSGIEYSLRILGDGAGLKEIQVAEEDMAFAESLLDSSAPPAKEGT